MASEVFKVCQSEFKHHVSTDFNLGNYGTGKTVLATEGSKIKLAGYDEMKMQSDEPEKLPEKIQAVIFNLRILSERNFQVNLCKIIYFFLGI